MDIEQPTLEEAVHDVRIALDSYLKSADTHPGGISAGNIRRKMAMDALTCFAIVKEHLIDAKVQRLELRPGDFLAVTYDKSVTAAMAERLRDQLSTMTGHKVLIFSDRAKLSVMSKAPEEQG